MPAALRLLDRSGQILQGSMLWTTGDFSVEQIEGFRASIAEAFGMEPDTIGVDFIDWDGAYAAGGEPLGLPFDEDAAATVQRLPVEAPPQVEARPAEPTIQDVIAVLPADAKSALEARLAQKV